jgi:hypothetical protein
MNPDEWPADVNTEEVFELVQDADYMTEHQNDGPITKD